MNDDLLFEMLNDAQMVPSDDKLSVIKNLVNEMIKIQMSIAQLEEMLATSKERLQHLSSKSVPDALASANLKTFTTDNGFKVEIKPVITAKIDDSNRQKCHDWLIQTGNSGLIKHVISADFDKGEDALARQLIKFLQAIEAPYTDKEAVHWATLNAFVKEQINKGADFPLDMFKVFIGNTTKIKSV